MSTISLNMVENELCYGIRYVLTLKDRNIENNNKENLNEILKDFSLNGINTDDVEMEKIETKTTRLRKPFSIKQKKSGQENECAFCRNNKEPMNAYTTHSLRDQFGRVICPKLRNYVCPICGLSGDKSHTIRYCKQKRIFTMEDTIPSIQNGMKQKNIESLAGSSRYIRL